MSLDQQREHSNYACAELFEACPGPVLWGYNARFSDGKLSLRKIFTLMMLDYHVCVCAIIAFEYFNRSLGKNVLYYIILVLLYLKS